MRSLLIVLDSVGVGGAPDAIEYGDFGADTLGHIVSCTGVRLPTLWSLGLGRIMGEAAAPAAASWGRMRPCSAGKDSTTGHWEIAGVVLKQPFSVFEHFPPELVRSDRERGGYQLPRQPGGERHADHRGYGSGALPYRPPHTLHLGQFRAADCGA